MAFLFSIAMFLFSCSSSEQSVNFQAPLFNNLGNYRIALTAASPHAAQFVVQGIIMANAFNHTEAARSFREAIRLDSTCAMAYWGLAYVLGPNYNTGSNMGESQEIQRAVQKALAYSTSASEWEHALILALALKFPENGEADATAYADAMKSVYERFPEDDFIITLYAEALMNLHAWDLYTRKGGEPKPWTPEIVTTLEKALRINPENPLANHLYIHATEGAPDVEKAIPSARRLKSLVPGAGHLVHMPSHIYINTGDYHLGSQANEEAVKADSIYIAQCQVTGVYPQLYFPHNWHFLAATAALEGRGARSIEAAFQTAAVIDQHYLREEGFETTQHYITIPYHVLVKFAQWEKLSVLPAPAKDLKYPTAMWHYVRGMAYANLGNLQKANDELEALKQLAVDESIRNTLIWEINTAADICLIAVHVLSGELHRISGKKEQAIKDFRTGISIEDKLNYNEPPDWFFSVRHYLGDVLLEMGRDAEAEVIYREDLTYWVKNGFALNGLYHSLLQQGKTEEATFVQHQFTEAWQRADSKLRYSRIDEESRTDLAIKLAPQSAPALVYLAGTMCLK